MYYVNLILADQTKKCDQPTPNVWLLKSVLCECPI